MTPCSELEYGLLKPSRRNMKTSSSRCLVLLPQLPSHQWKHEHSCNQFSSNPSQTKPAPPVTLISIVGTSGRWCLSDWHVKFLPLILHKRLRGNTAFILALNISGKDCYCWKSKYGEQWQNKLKLRKKTDNIKISNMKTNWSSPNPPRNHTDNSERKSVCERN